MSALEKLYETVLELAAEVPFGNSDTQNRVAIINDECTPARAFRHAALRVMNRLEALREAKFGQRKRAIEIQILERDRDACTDPLRAALIDLDIEHKRSAEPYARKLIADAIGEIESLWPVLAQGKLSREEFEAGEVRWYELKHNMKLDLKYDLYAKITRPALNKVAEPALRLPSLRDEFPEE